MAGDFAGEHESGSTVAADLEIFVRLAHRSLVDDALDWYGTRLKRHEQESRVLVEYTDMLLQEGLYEKLVQVVDDANFKSLSAEESQLLESTLDLAIIRSKRTTEAEILEKAARCRDYLKEAYSTKVGQDGHINAIFARTVRVYLGIVVAASDAGYLTEADHNVFTNPPWSSPSSARWSGFLTWYTQLRASTQSWEAHQLLRLLLPVVSPHDAFATLIHRDQFTPITAKIKSHSADKTALLAELATSNTICAHLLTISFNPPPILRAIAYLGASRKLRGVLLQLAAPTDDYTLPRAKPILRIDDLAQSIRSAVHAGLSRHAFDTDTVEKLLLTCAGEGDATAVRLILTLYKADVSPNHEDQQWRTPLSHAAEGGHEEVVELLLGTKGVDAGGRDFAGRSALSYAAAGGHAGVVEMLVARGGRGEESDGEGRTVMERAVEGGHRRVVELLGGKGG
ncbi:hypothetical protein C8A05DRAFT_18038 [Staphylotrichum tortipilum]|uniref:Ankyrin repeat protein n=1 Tax=Staphylotrichum tortipilum TaxID=2831512 RepID=A0AAN6RQC3_9PEZI|nr:hypothetical protein C8A05DRAFT_18038 [Staphylotrichum longicolle]